MPIGGSLGASAPGLFFPCGRLGQGGFALLTQQGFHFLARNPRPGIIGGGLDAALEQFAAQTGIGFQLLMLAQAHEHGFGSRPSCWCNFPDGLRS